MNLITDAWLPVRRKRGARAVIAPHELTTDCTEDPVICLDWPRPDLNSAVTQLFIGLLQSCSQLVTPNARQWRRKIQTPPTPDELSEALAPLIPMFELDTPNAAFMQDLTLASESKVVNVPISSLLIDSPGENTLKENKDFFIKRGQVEELCAPCAAAALYTLQTFAPSGGQGHRTGLRGGGPLSSIVLGNTLWETLWSNVLPSLMFEQLGNIECTDVGHQFPWMDNTITSENKRELTPMQVHPLHLYWAMPRRIRLQFEDTEETICPLCQRQTQRVVRQYRTKNFGYNYGSQFQHPLSPYRESKNLLFAVKGSPEGIAYRHWRGLVYSTTEETDSTEQKTSTTKQYAAKVVELNRNQNNTLQRSYFRLWISGYDMDNMKARGWVESTIPVYHVPDDHLKKYIAYVARLIDAAEIASKALQTAVLEGMFYDNKDRKKKRSTTSVSVAATRFWAETEPNFYPLLQKLAVPSFDDAKHWDALARRWLSQLSQHAKAIFMDMCPPDAHHDGRIMQRRYVALRWLSFNTGPFNKNMCTALKLSRTMPEPPQSPAPEWATHSTPA